MATYTKKQLESLTEDELVQLGQDEFNLELSTDMLKDAIVTEIWDAYKAAKESAKDAQASLDATPAADKEKIKITVAPGGENDPDYITPAINGRVWQIKRGQEVEVPKFVARHIQGLKQTIYKPVMDKDGKVTGKKAEEVNRYNVQVAI